MTNIVQGLTTTISKRLDRMYSLFRNRGSTMGARAHDDVIKWKYFLRYWPFVRGIHRTPVNSPHKGQWREALMFSLICVWINGWVNNREAGDLRRYRAHYDVIVMRNGVHPNEGEPRSTRTPMMNSISSIMIFFNDKFKKTSEVAPKSSTIKFGGRKSQLRVGKIPW